MTELIHLEDDDILLLKVKDPPPTLEQADKMAQMLGRKVIVLRESDELIVVRTKKEKET